jgi:hypothetical protein
LCLFSEQRYWQVTYAASRDIVHSTSLQNAAVAKTSCTV